MSATVKCCGTCRFWPDKHYAFRSCSWRPAKLPFWAWVGIKPSAAHGKMTCAIDGEECKAWEPKR